MMSGTDHGGWDHPTLAQPAVVDGGQEPKRSLFQRSRRGDLPGQKASPFKMWQSLRRKLHRSLRCSGSWTMVGIAVFTTAAFATSPAVQGAGWVGRGVGSAFSHTGSGFQALLGTAPESWGLFHQAAVAEAPWIFPLFVVGVVIANIWFRG